jgi:predicted  nucleic acid-binding Zn-ribbon protein
MTQEIRALLVLQERDSKLFSLKESLAYTPDDITEAEEQLARDRTAAETIQKEVRRLEGERKHFELEAEGRRRQLDKFKAQLLQTRKNEEYQALLHQIGATEQEIGSIEDRELEVMEQLELARAKCDQQMARWKVREKTAEEHLAALRRRPEVLGPQIAELEKERPNFTANISPETLSRYERLLRAKDDGLAVVQLGDAHACGGCNMQVSTQTAHDALSGKRLGVCEHCGRFLYSAAALT